MVAARYLGPAVRHRLRVAGVSHVDATGNMWILASRPGFFVRGDGSDTDPWRGPGGPRGKQAARANTEENFGYVFDKQFEGLVLDRHDANAELIDRVFQGRGTTNFFTAMARKIVDQLVRGVERGA